MQTKRCSKCRRGLPIEGNFAKNRAMKDGLHCWCNECRWEYNRTHREELKQRKHDAYWANPERERERSRQHYATHKEQRSAYAKQYRQKNRAKIRAQWLRWFESNREYYREWNRNHYAKNRARYRAYLNAWRYQNIEKEREYALSWRTRHPDRWRALRLRRRAAHVGLPGTITARQWRYCLEYWHHRCAVCGRPRGFWLTIAADHWIPVSSPDCPGSVPTNIIPLCHGRGGCNGDKLDKDGPTWLLAKLGKRKGRQKLAEIEAYFEHLRSLSQDIA